MNEEKVATPKRMRSPGYPAIGLAEAIAKIKTIHATQRQYPSNRETLAHVLGYSGLTGTSARVIAALSDFGMLEGYGESLRVSDLGQDLALHRPGDAEYAAALNAALSSPQFFRDLDDLYPEGLPSEHALRATLIKKGFTHKAIDAAIKVYVESKSLAPETKSQKEKRRDSDEEDDRLERDSDEGSEKGGGGSVGPRVRTLSIPVSAEKWAELSAEFPLTEAEWVQLQAILEAMKPSLTIPSGLHAPVGSNTE